MGIIGRAAEEITAEIAKCDLVCANCHATRTHVRGPSPEQRVGSPPLGQRAGAVRGNWQPVPAEAAAVARIGELRAAGQPIRAIIEVLEAEGYQPKRGGRWHPETVRRILARRTGHARAA